MKKSIMILLITCMSLVTALPVFAAEKTNTKNVQVEVDGKIHDIEVIGNVEFVAQDELRKIVGDSPVIKETVQPRSINSFKFTIDDETHTTYESNTKSTWTVTTKARIYNKKKKTYTDDPNHKYLVYICTKDVTPLMGYYSYADNREGGLKFENVPNESLCIQVQNDSALWGSNYLKGTGKTNR